MPQEQKGVLRDAEGTQLDSSQEKVDGFVRDIFGEEDQWEIPGSKREYPEWPMKDRTLQERVLMAIRGTSNKLAAGPDGIGYCLIKLIAGTRLGRELVTLIVDHLERSLIPEG